MRFTYDARGRLVENLQGQCVETRSIQYEYYPDGPSQGYLHSITDSLGEQIGYDYDLAGRLIRQTLPDGREIAFSYDANGNLIGLTPPGKPAHAFEYTPVDLASAYTPPTATPGGETRYAYDLDRKLTRITRPDAQTVDFRYDAAGRLQTLTTPEGDTTYGYSATTGKLTSITAPDGGILGYGYDGSLLTRMGWSGTVAGSVGFAYDSDFRVREITLNAANPVAFGFDADSLLTSAGALSLRRDTQNGLLTGTTLGKVSDSLGYNGFGEVNGYSAIANGSVVFLASYTRDKLGRITQKVETVQGIGTTYDYAYDLAGRLLEVKQNGATTAAYGYDDNGNRTTLNGLPIAVYDDQDRLTIYNGVAYAYTANGELQSKTQDSQTTQYHYDVLGNLRQATLPEGTQIDYPIDGQDRRIGKKRNGVLEQGFLYQDGLRIVAELNGSNQVVSRFVYADKGNLPSYLVKGGVTYRIISDHLGSPRLVVNTSNGAIVQRMDYDEWGRVLLDTNPGFQPFGFAGGLYDRDTGLVRFGARDYDPETGRWTAKDPIGFAGGDANLFGYVAEDPVNGIDPRGMSGDYPYGVDGIGPTGYPSGGSGYYNYGTCCEYGYNEYGNRYLVRCHSCSCGVKDLTPNPL